MFQGFLLAVAPHCHRRRTRKRTHHARDPRLLRRELRLAGKPLPLAQETGDRGFPAVFRTHRPLQLHAEQIRHLLRQRIAREHLAPTQHEAPYGRQRVAGHGRIVRQRHGLHRREQLGREVRVGNDGGPHAQRLQGGGHVCGKRHVALCLAPAFRGKRLRVDDRHVGLAAARRDVRDGAHRAVRAGAPAADAHRGDFLPALHHALGAELPFRNPHVRPDLVLLGREGGAVPAIPAPEVAAEGRELRQVAADEIELDCRMRAQVAGQLHVPARARGGRGGEVHGQLDRAGRKELGGPGRFARRDRGLDGGGVRQCGPSGQHAGLARSGYVGQREVRRRVELRRTRGFRTACFRRLLSAVAAPRHQHRRSERARRHAD